MIGRRPAFAIAMIFTSMLAGPVTAAEEGAFALPDGARVVFFGDSITQAGDYVTYAEAFLLTRFPDRRYTIVNHGISSETVSGTSEPDHPTPRPNALDRFARDVAAWKPDAMVACFGMNDGNYHPPDPARFAKYRAGVETLLARARDEAGARFVTLLTPPPFDPYSRQVGDPMAVHYGYRFPAVDYDDTLRGYADFLLTKHDPASGLVVADDHALVNAHLAARRKQRVSFTLAPDAVHPNPTGHALMALSLLLAWQAPPVAAVATIDAGSLAVEGSVSGLAREGEGLVFAWKAPLPWPYDPEWDAESVAVERFGEQVNQYRLIAKGLTAPRYRLKAALVDARGPEVPVGEYTRDQLAAGLDLAALPRFPTTYVARSLLAELKARRRSEYDAWRRSPDRVPPDAPRDDLRSRCRQTAVRIRLEALGVR